MWTKVSVSILDGITFLVTTAMCHEIPRLPNQSDWLSRYFLGRNSMAQSKTISTEFESKLLMVFNLASSWLTVRSKCTFQASIVFLDWETRYNISSFSSFGISAFSKAVLISSKTEGTNRHLSH